MRGSHTEYSFSQWESPLSHEEMESIPRIMWELHHKDGTPYPVDAKESPGAHIRKEQDRPPQEIFFRSLTPAQLKAIKNMVVGTRTTSQVA